MKNEFMMRTLNVSLRGLSMGCRFILIIVIAKLLEPSQVGAFGLMLATISFSVLIIGADYYTYTQRELLARKADQWYFVIQQQIKAQLILYIFLLPVQLLFFFFGFMDWQNSIWFFCILLTEHISQEINRLLIAMHKQLLASLILFIRAGSWIIIIIPLMYSSPQYRNLDTIYTAWLIGSLFALIIGAILIKQNLTIWKPVKTDFVWIKKGFRVGGKFLIATLCLKAIMTFDRYLVEYASSTEFLGIYVFYISIVMGVFGILDPAIFSFLYPRMLQSYQHGDKINYQKHFKELALSTFASSLILGIVIWVLVPYVIIWIGKPLYSSHLDYLLIFITAGFIYTTSYIPHYALYAKKEDKWIIYSHISAIIVFFICFRLVHFENSIKNVSISLVFTFLWILMTKTIGLLLTNKDCPQLKALYK